ncbi:hypothetical protein CR513_11680, partial [Mucuna pruriens]
MFVQEFLYYIKQSRDKHDGRAQVLLSTSSSTRRQRYLDSLLISCPLYAYVQDCNHIQGNTFKSCQKNFRYLISTLDLNYARDKIERKSTIRGCHFIGPCLVSWASKKQNSIALSTTEVEYVSITGCFSQFLWVKYQLEEYSSFEHNIPIF